MEQYSNPRDDDGYFIWEADIMRGSAMSALNELRELAPDLITPEDMSKIIILAATSN